MEGELEAHLEEDVEPNRRNGKGRKGVKRRLPHVGIEMVLSSLLYIGENEGAKFWMQVLTDLQSRGVQDIFIACIDHLQGFADAVEALFPQTEVQLCVIHQVRNSRKYLAWKDVKPFVRDLQQVYKATTKESAERYLDQLQSKLVRQVSKSDRILATELGSTIELFQNIPRRSERSSTQRTSLLFREAYDST